MPLCLCVQFFHTEAQRHGFSVCKSIRLINDEIISAVCNAGLSILDLGTQKIKIMTPQEIATRLHELCSQFQYETAQQELYAAHATSTESNREGKMETVSGIDAIIEKGKHFRSMIVEMHGGYTKEPEVYGKNIFMVIGIDATMKEGGRTNKTEMAHYVVANGKIISETFYY